MLKSAINVQPNGTSAVRRLSKKLHKGVKNIFGKKSAREEGFIYLCWKLKKVYLFF